MKLILPLAISFFISSCPNHEELPRNLSPFAHAESAARAIEHTIGKELLFLPDNPALSEEERNSFDSFLASEKIRELKIILWLPPEASSTERALVNARSEYLAGLMQANRIPFSIHRFESPFYEDFQGSLLAILE